jgi:hypothetical protein
VQVCLGLEIDGPASRVSFVRPQLPSWLGELRVRNLQVAGATVDLEVVRRADELSVNVSRRDGALQVVIVR